MAEYELQSLLHRMMCSPATLMVILNQVPNLQALDLGPSFSGGWDGYEGYYKSDDEDEEDRSQIGDEDDERNLEGKEGEEYEISDPNDEEEVETYEDISEHDAEAAKKQATQYANGVNAFMVSLIGPLSKLRHLRHLGVRSQGGLGCSERGIAQLISTLPRLTSFAGEAIGYQVERQIRHQKSQTLGWQLSRLAHLTKLDLCHIFPKDTTWCHNLWSSKLISLALENCQKDHKFIHIFASSLVQLKLKSLPSSGQRLMYRLPQLSELYLHETRNTELSNFVECSNLRQISCEYYNHPSPTLQTPGLIQHWQNLQQLRFLTKSFWSPSLEPREIAEWRALGDDAGFVVEFVSLPWDI